MNMTYFHARVLDFFDVGNLGDVGVNAVPIYFCEAGMAVMGGGTASRKRATATSEKNKSQIDQASTETFIKLNALVKSLLGCPDLVYQDLVTWAIY